MFAQETENPMPTTFTKGRTYVAKKGAAPRRTVRITGYTDKSMQVVKFDVLDAKGEPTKRGEMDISRFRDDFEPKVAKGAAKAPSKAKPAKAGAR